MQIEVSLPLSNCRCKGYMEEQYVSFRKSCIGPTINTKPSHWATHFPAGLGAAPLQECPVAVHRIWRCFMLRLRHELQATQRGSGHHTAGTGRAKYSNLSPPSSQLEHAGVIYWNFFSPFALALLGLPRAFIFSRTRFCLALQCQSFYS